MWDLPGPGLEPVSPALAGRFLTTAPPGKSPKFLINEPKAFLFPLSSDTIRKLYNKPALQNYSHLKKIYIFMKSMDSHTGIRTNRERAPSVPFVQFLPMVTFCKTTVQYHNQDIDIARIHSVI